MRYLKGFLLALLLLGVCGGCSQDSSQPGATAAKVGQVAPDFTLRDMQGREVSLSAYRGKVVLVNFWATWCPPCREEMPSMERLHQFYKDQGLVFLAVNVEASGGVVVGPFLQQHDYSFPVLLDSEAKAQTRYGVFRFPETFLIDKNGVIVDKIIGARDWMGKDILQQIYALLKA